MQKEMIISVLVGLFFGLIIVYGVYTARVSLSSPNQTTQELGVSPSPEATDGINGNLSIFSPEDETIVSEPLITITGSTIARDYVIVFINDEESITNADESGYFSIEGELELGSNIIEIYTIDEDGQTTVIERTVVYSTTQPLVEETAQVDHGPAPITPAETASSSPTLQERVLRVAKEKYTQVQGAIDQLSTNKRGFIGQVERVTQESLTLTNSKGTEIISINDQVALLKANKEISIDGVAVGDWLVVMGLIIDDTFSPKRVLVSSSSLRPRNHLVSLGTIIDQSSQKLSILSRKEEEIEFDLNKKTNFQDHNGDAAQSSKFMKDLQVLVIGYEDDEGKIASTIRTLVSLEILQDE